MSAKESPNDVDLLLIMSGDFQLENVSEACKVLFDYIGAKKWRDEYNESLKGKHVVLIPDNDNEGRGHMAQVYYKIGTLKAFAITSSPLFKRPGDILVLQ